VIHLTRQEQTVLCAVLGLLLVGWAVKAYRTAHPPARSELLQHSAPEAAAIMQEKSNP